MRIASYNIRKAVGLDWRRNPGRIVDVLAEIDADVVVLQEADKRVGARAGVLPLEKLEADLGYDLAPLATRPLSHGWHGNAILVRGLKTAKMPDLIDLPTIEPRGAVSVFLEKPDLEIIGIHLALTTGTRRKQIDALRRHLSEARHPVVIAGDFNDWSKGDKLDRVFGDEFRVISPGNSFHAARPVAPLDRFVLNGPIRPLRAEVHRTPLARRASDHLPIVIELDFSR